MSLGYIIRNYTDNVIIEYIIDYDINDKTLEDMLMQFIYNNRVGVIKYVIDRIGINNITDIRYYFHNAAYYGYYDTVNELLNYNIIYEDQNNILTSAYIAGTRRHEDVKQLIIQKIEIYNRLKKLKILLNNK